jgi:hypothetical protein
MKGARDMNFDDYIIRLDRNDRAWWNDIKQDTTRRAISVPGVSLASPGPFAPSRSFADRDLSRIAADEKGSPAMPRYIASAAAKVKASTKRVKSRSTAKILRRPVRFKKRGPVWADASSLPPAAKILHWPIADVWPDAKAKPAGRTLAELGWPFPEATYGRRADAKDPGTVFKDKLLRKAAKAAVAAFTKSGDMGDAALAYAANGLPIFPLDPVTKAPIPRRDKDEDGNPIPGTGGVYKATLDEKQIRKWWRNNPNALIGLPMGVRTGVWALDVDTSEDHADGVAEWKRITAKHDPIKTREHRSATDGPHLIFVWDGGHPIFCSRGSLPNGIEVKGQGGYIVVPPSQRKGRSYTVFSDIDPIKPPQFLLDMIGTDRPRSAADPDKQLVAGDINELAFAVSITPNDLKGWKEWKDYCMALFNACAGSDEGFEMFDEFSQRWTGDGGYDKELAQKCWDEVTGCPPNEIGAGTVFMKASEADAEWRTAYQEQIWDILRAARQQNVDDLPEYSLDEVHEAFRKWFGNDYDLDAIDAVCAAGASERLTGDPLWLLLISGPGAAKTETAQSLSGAGAHITSTIASEGALLSASPKKSRVKTATGGLLRKIGDRGILVIKDVTTILSASRDMRGMVLAAIREIHDGRWERNVGTDGGQTLTWTGRIVIVGAVTTAWDAAHAVVATMGDRFVLIRIDSNVSRQRSGTQAINNTGSETQMREELAAVVGGLIANASTDELTLDEEEVEQLVKAADIVTMARTAVERDFKGDVVFSHAPEMPTRFAKQLTQIIRGGVAIGMSRERAMQLAIRCARDSIPPLRLEIILDVAINPNATIGDVRRRTSKPWSTVKREIEGLHMLGIFYCNETFDEDQDKHKWQYSLSSDFDYKTLHAMAGRERITALAGIAERDQKAVAEKAEAKKPGHVMKKTLTAKAGETPDECIARVEEEEIELAKKQCKKKGVDFTDEMLERMRADQTRQKRTVIFDAEAKKRMDNVRHLDRMDQIERLKRLEEAEKAKHPAEAKETKLTKAEQLAKNAAVVVEAAKAAKAKRRGKG